MATLRDIRQRIRSVRDIQQITRAMKMVATAKHQKAIVRLEQIRRTAQAVEDSVQQVAAGVPAHQHPLLQPPDPAATGAPDLLVVTGDRGLCGSFNHNVMRSAAQELQRDTQRSVWAFGRRGAAALRRLESDVQQSWEDRSDGLDYALASEVADTFYNRVIAGESLGCHILSQRYRSVGTQEVTVTSLLPLTIASRAADAVQQQSDFLYEPGAAAALGQLFRWHVRYQVLLALVESYAAEQAARMMSMDQATNNADELLHELVLAFNKARQTTITTEVLEVVSGAAALV